MAKPREGDGDGVAVGNDFSCLGKREKEIPFLLIKFSRERKGILVIFCWRGMNGNMNNNDGSSWKGLGLDDHYGNLALL